MNAEEPKEQREPARLVELQPLNLKPLPDRHLPIPEEDPPHRCLQCDYILTGLVSRRCPECGTPFKLRAPHRTPTIGGQDRTAILSDRIAFRGGILLLIAGTVAPMISLDGSDSFSVPLRFLMVGCGMLILTVAFAYKSFFQRTWPEAMLLAGLSSVALATLLVF